MHSSAVFLLSAFHHFTISSVSEFLQQTCLQTVWWEIALRVSKSLLEATQFESFWTNGGQCGRRVSWLEERPRQKVGLGASSVSCGAVMRQDQRKKETTLPAQHSTVFRWLMGIWLFSADVWDAKATLFTICCQQYVQNELTLCAAVKLWIN